MPYSTIRSKQDVSTNLTSKELLVKNSIAPIVPYYLTMVRIITNKSQPVKHNHVTE